MSPWAEAAIDEGVRIARALFARRGDHSEMHITEMQLAASLAIAFERGAAFVESKLEAGRLP